MIRSPITNFNREARFRTSEDRQQRVVSGGGGGGSSATSFLLLSVGPSQTLATYGATTIKGLSYLASDISAVPAAAPTGGSTYSAGIGYGYIIDQTTGAVSSSLVWLLNASTVNTTNNGDLIAPIPENAQVVAYRKVTISISGGGTTTAYIVGFC